MFFLFCQSWLVRVRIKAALIERQNHDQHAASAGVCVRVGGGGLQHRPFGRGQVCFDVLLRFTLRSTQQLCVASQCGTVVQ